MLKLEITKDAMKFLEILAGKHYKQVVSAIFGLLKNPGASRFEEIVWIPVFQDRYRRISGRF